VIEELLHAPGQTDKRKVIVALQNVHKQNNKIKNL